MRDVVRSPYGPGSSTARAIPCWPWNTTHIRGRGSAQRPGIVPDDAFRRVCPRSRPILDRKAIRPCTAHGCSSPLGGRASTHASGALRLLRPAPHRRDDLHPARASPDGGRRRHDRGLAHHRPPPELRLMSRPLHHMGAPAPRATTPHVHPAGPSSCRTRTCKARRLDVAQPSEAAHHPRHRVGHRDHRPRARRAIVEIAVARAALRWGPSSRCGRSWCTRARHPARGQRHPRYRRRRGPWRAVHRPGAAHLPKSNVQRSPRRPLTPFLTSPALPIEAQRVDVALPGTIPVHRF